MLAPSPAKSRFRLVLIKPSHYDDDGYVIQWFRSPIPANSLACLYGLAVDCAERHVLGADVALEIVAIDETNQRIRPEKLARSIREAGAGMVMLVGVQSNQFPRALDLTAAFRKAGRHRRHRRLPRLRHALDAARDRAERAEGARSRRLRLRRRGGGGAARRGAGGCERRAAEADLQFHGRPARHRARADPASSGRGRPAHLRREHQLRRRPRLPVPVLLLHHHQRAGPKVAPPLGRRRGAHRAREPQARAPALLHHRRQFRPQQGLGADLRPADRDQRARRRRSLASSSRSTRSATGCRTSSRRRRAPASGASSSGWKTSAPTISPRPRRSRTRSPNTERCCSRGRTPRSSPIAATSSAFRTTRRNGSSATSRWRSASCRSICMEFFFLTPAARLGGPQEALREGGLRWTRTSTNTT